MTLYLWNKCRLELITKHLLQYFIWRYRFIRNLAINEHVYTHTLVSFMVFVGMCIYVVVVVREKVRENAAGYMYMNCIVHTWNRWQRWQWSVCSISQTLWKYKQYKLVYYSVTCFSMFHLLTTRWWSSTNVLKNLLVGSNAYRYKHWEVNDYAVAVSTIRYYQINFIY